VNSIEVSNKNYKKFTYNFHNFHSYTVSTDMINVYTLIINYSEKKCYEHSLISWVNYWFEVAITTSKLVIIVCLKFENKHKSLRLNYDSKCNMLSTLYYNNGITRTEALKFNLLVFHLCS